MSHYLLRMLKYTQIFNRRNAKTLPSLRPPIHILIDTKLTHEYDLIALAAWSTKRNNNFEQSRLGNSVINDLQITGHVTCSANIPKTTLALKCYISALNAVIPCLECQHFLRIVPLDLHSLSFENIRTLESVQKSISYTTEFSAYGYGLA